MSPVAASGRDRGYLRDPGERRIAAGGRYNTVVRDAQLGRRRVDRLVEVASRDAVPPWASPLGDGFALGWVAERTHLAQAGVVALRLRQRSLSQAVTVQHDKGAFQGFVAAQQRQEDLGGFFRVAWDKPQVHNRGWTVAPLEEDQFPEIAIEGDQAAPVSVRSSQHRYVARTGGNLPDRCQVEAGLTQT